jgi:hypothetical protein
MLLLIRAKGAIPEMLTSVPTELTTPTDEQVQVPLFPPPSAA